MTAPGLCWMLSPPDGRAGAGQRVLHLAHAVHHAGLNVRLIRPDRQDVHKPLAQRCDELLRQWQAERPRWVYVEVPEPASEPWRQVARHLKIPLLTTWHPIDWMAPPAHQADLRRYLHAFLGDCAQVLAETPAIQTALQGHDLHQTTVVSNGVDTEFFHPRRRTSALRAQWGADADSVIALHVGRLEPEKNLSLLTDAFLAVRAAQPQARLVCIGAGTGRDQLAATVPGLILPGFLQGEVLAEAYASGDLFLFPSLDDPYGNVVLEAAASGLAIVAFDRAAAGMHLHEAAALVASGDAAAYIAETQRLAADKAARMTLSRYARQATESCSWRATALAFITALQTTESLHRPTGED